VRTGRDDGRVTVEAPVVRLDRVAVERRRNVRDFRPGVNIDVRLFGGLLDERLRRLAVIDDVAVRRLQRKHVLRRVAALHDFGLDLADLLAIDRSKLRVEVAEAVLVPLLEFRDLLVTDAEHHLAALGVHLSVGRCFPDSPRGVRSLFDLFGLLERVVRLDIPEVEGL